MADIAKYLQDILQARYGEEVRGSIHDAIEAINGTANEAKKLAEQAVNTANEANKKSDQAVSTANQANTKSDQAVATANRAETNSQQALQRAADAEEAAEESAASAAAAKKDADSAAASATAAQASAKTAETKATEAAASAATATQKATDAAASAASAQADAAAAKKDADAAKTDAASAKADAAAAETSASNAESSAATATAKATQAATDAASARADATAARNDADSAAADAATARTDADTARKDADSAKASATTAETKATEAAASAADADERATAAETSAAAAEKTAAEAATNSAQASEDAAAAAASAATATEKATSAAADAKTARQDADTAKEDADTARELAESARRDADTIIDQGRGWVADAQTAASRAADSATAADVSADAAAASATEAAGYEEGAQNYYEQTKGISEGLNGVLIPVGSITFSQLASQSPKPGYTYNITDGFTTTADFREGDGKYYGPGANVYWTADEKWDVLAPVMVTGVKGSSESSYRQGQVSLSAANVGALGVNDKAKSAATADTLSATLPVAKGGTGVTSLTGTAGLLRALFDTDLNGNTTDTKFVPVFTSNWADGGYLNFNELKAKMDLNNVNNTADANKTVASAHSLLPTNTANYDVEIIPVKGYSYGDLGVASSEHPQYLQALVKKLASAYGAGTKDRIFIGVANPDSRSFFIYHVYLNSVNANGLFNYSSGVMFRYPSAQPYLFGTADGTFGTNTIYTTGAKPTASDVGALPVTGNAASASKLATAHNLKVNLASSSAASFNGSADATGIGVSGTLPVANGGTGNSSGKAISASTADKLTTARNLKVNLASSSAASFNGSADATGIGVSGTLPVANGGTGNSSGKAISASTADKLTTARNLKVALNSTSAVAFDGSKAVENIGVTGTLPVANGGTGVTSLVGNAGLIRAMFDSDLNSDTNSKLVPVFTSNWADGGYLNMTELKTSLGLKNVNNTADSAKSVKYATSAGSANGLAFSTLSISPVSGVRVTSAYKIGNFVFIGNIITSRTTFQENPSGTGVVIATGLPSAHYKDTSIVGCGSCLMRVSDSAHGSFSGVPGIFYIHSNKLILQARYGNDGYLVSSDTTIEIEFGYAMYPTD